MSDDDYKFKDIPYLMRLNNKFNESDFIVIPKTTSENREYIPLGFETAGSIPSMSISIIQNCNMYLFGILISKLHMIWMKTITGRLEMRYRYSSDIVYNNFPWPSISDFQKKEIEKTAQDILDARALYPDASLADLYDPLLMPLELRKTHKRNDDAVIRAYALIQERLVMRSV